MEREEFDDRPGQVEQPGLSERAIRDLKDYASLRADSVRLALIDNLATLFNTLFSVALLIVLAGIGTVFFAVALTWILGWIIGSMLYAILFMGTLFLIATLVVYRNRNRLIVDRAVQMLARMMNDMIKKYSDDGKS